jgi:hypothetical protein
MCGSSAEEAMATLTRWELLTAPGADAAQNVCVQEADPGARIRDLEA